MTENYRKNLHNLINDIYQKHGIKITLNEWVSQRGRHRVEFYVSGALIGDSLEAMTSKEAYRSLLVAYDLLEILVEVKQ